VSEGSAPGIFGTDGVRDRAGSGLLAPDAIVRLVEATARVLEDRARFPSELPGPEARGVVLGRDTRESGTWISEAVAASFARCGYEVHDLGVLPTPGVAWIASAWPGTALGIVISASHNPAEWNGIKFTSASGAKASPEIEKAISDAFHASGPGSPRSGPAPGRIRERSDDAFEAYVSHLAALCRRPERFRGRTVALDPANGAAYRVAPEVFRRLGARVVCRANQPDGRNINLGSGAVYPQALAALVLEARADAGFAFDGDADRMIPISAGGRVLDGDHVLYLAGKSYSRAGKLPLRSIVGTVMANVGLEVALREEGLSLIRTDVGDRHVYLEMTRGNHPVGGEQSGHVIFLDDSRTGDGALAAVRMADLVEGDALDLERETSALEKYPQVLENVRVPEKRPFESMPGVLELVAGAEKSLGSTGRVLLRYSGTEPLARVMLEGPDATRIRALAREICDAIRAAFERG
jgi:phosphoglucosamine mutase